MRSKNITTTVLAAAGIMLAAVGAVGVAVPASAVTAPVTSVRTPTGGVTTQALVCHYVTIKADPWWTCINPYPGQPAPGRCYTRSKLVCD